MVLRVPCRLPLRSSLIRPIPRTITFTRTYASPTSSHSNAQRAAQEDREKMDTQPNEYAKSSTDSSAANDKVAFDPKGSNDPEEARKEASGDLDASPANPELSSGTSEVSPGADKKMSEGGGGRSGGGDSTGDKSSGSSV